VRDLQFAGGRGELRLGPDFWVAHSALGYMPPVEFEAQLKAPNMEAAAGQRVAMSFSRHRESFGPMQK
jgi:hypothetical protein